MSKKTKNTRKKLIDVNNYNLCTQSAQEKSVLQIRSLQVRKAQTIQYLNGTTMPQDFRFRQKQIEKIEAFLQACLKKQKKGYRFMMVTGSPGAGKTLSMNSVMSKMQCEIIRMNANVVKSVANVQDLISLRLLGDEKPRTANQILRELEQKKYNKCCIVYIQEIQVLFKSAPDIVSQDFLSLFLKKTVNLVLLGISNTIDTLQRYSGKYSFKVTQIENVVFAPYKAQQIMTILSDKIKYIHKHFQIKIDLQDRLLKFASQKLQTLKKGDFRICGQFLKQAVRRSFDGGQSKEETYIVTIGIINQVFQKMQISKNDLMSFLTCYQVVLLISLHNIIKKTQGLYVSMNQLTPEIKWICNSMLLTHESQGIQRQLKELQQYGLVALRNKKNMPIQILLQVGVQEINVTFYQSQVWSKFLAK